MSNGSEMFRTIGWCSTIGKNGWKYMGVVGGVATFGVMTFASWTGANTDPANPVPLDASMLVIPALVGLGAGAFVAFSTYLTCKGVRRGIPVSRR